MPANPARRNAARGSSARSDFEQRRLDLGRRASGRRAEDPAAVVGEVDAQPRRERGRVAATSARSASSPTQRDVHHLGRVRREREAGAGLGGEQR